jgi:hypothetical protein
MNMWNLIWQCILETLVTYGWIIVVPVISSLLFNKKDRTIIIKWLKQALYFLTLVISNSIIKTVRRIHYEA